MLTLVCDVPIPLNHQCTYMYMCTVKKKEYRVHITHTPHTHTHTVAGTCIHTDTLSQCDTCVWHWHNHR